MAHKRSTEYALKITIFIICIIFSSYGLTDSTPTTQWTFQTNGPIYSTVAGDKKTLYAASTDGQIYALSKKTGELLWTYVTEGAIYSDITLFGQYLYVQSDDGYTYKIQKKNGNLKWRTLTNTANNKPRNAGFEPGGWDDRASAPVVIGKYIYLRSADNHLYALNDNTGNMIWKFNASSQIRSTPAIKEKKVIVGTFGGIIYCIDKLTGKEIWHLDTEIGRETLSRRIAINSNPTITGDLVIIGSRNLNLYALNVNDGEIYWVYPYTKSWVESTATVDDDVVYVGSSFLRSQHAIDLKTGTLIWQNRTIDGLSFSKPTITPSAYYTGIAGGLNIRKSKTFAPYGGVVKLDRKTGHELWRFDLKNFHPQIKERGVVGAIHEDNGEIYFAALDGKVYSIK